MGAYDFVQGKTLTRDERDDKMVRLYADGVPITRLAERFGISRQRVDQILKSRGAVSAAEARQARVRKQAWDLRDAAENFLGSYADIIASLAASGTTRAQLEAKFSLLDGEVSADVVAEALRMSRTVFDVNREEYIFPRAAVEAAVFYMIARNEGIVGDVSSALRELTLEEMHEISSALEDAGLPPVVVKRILLMVAGARRGLTERPDLTISKQAYDAERRIAVDDLGLESGRGLRAWPPTSQTIMKRLGGGYWKDALVELGVSVSARGRSRGLLRFDESDYSGAMREFIQHCADIAGPDTFEAYEVWVGREDRAGRQRPSGPAMRNFYGSWINAKRAAITGHSAPILGSTTVTVAASVARTGLHDAHIARKDGLARIAAAGPLDRLGVLAEFVKNYMSEFEVRRREWLRALILGDGDALARRLSEGSLSGAQRRAVESSTPDVAAALTDMYLDRMLSDKEGVRNADRWLAVDSQAQLDDIPDVHVKAALVLREVRNYFTHESAEAERRLAEAVAELSHHDSRFVSHSRLTRRNLGSWLSSNGAARLDSLTQSIIEAWRAMLAAEAIQNA